MALVRVGASSGANDIAASLVAAGSLGTTSGNCLLVAVVTNANTANDVSSVTDTAGNSFSRVTQINNGTYAGDLELWIATGITGNVANIVTANHSANNSAIIVEEWSGVATSSATDTSNTGTDSSSPLQSGSFTTANAIDIIFCAVAQRASPTFSAATGFSNVTQQSFSTNRGLGIASKTVSSTGSYTGDMNSTSSGATLIIGAGIKAAQAGGGAVRTMMGIG